MSNLLNRLRLIPKYVEAVYCIRGLRVRVNVG